MLWGVSGAIWVILLVCIAIAFAYAAIDGRLSGKGADWERYQAVALCALIAVAATVISKNQHYAGAPMVALLIGIAIVNLAPHNALNQAFKAGTSFVGKKYLSLGIVCLGATLAFTDIFSAVFALPLVLFNMVLSFAVAYLIGRKALRVSSNTCTLVGGGTCICGGTAIAVLSSIVKAKEEETAYAMTAIFLFDLLACLSYPYLAIRLGFNGTQFGFFAGTAINDTSSVIAAQETYASLIGLENYVLPATIKVMRTSMIIVLALVFALLSVRGSVRSSSADQSQAVSIGSIVWKSFPKFILFFVGTVALNTILVKTAQNTEFYSLYFKPFFSNGYKFFVTLALAGVGFKIKFRDLFTKGLKPIILGGCTWLSLFLSSLLAASRF